MRLFAGFLCFAIATAAQAVAPQFWRLSSADDFLRGELHGMTISSRGELRPGPAADRIAAIADPFVLSLASGGGETYFGTGNAGKVYRLRNGKLDLLYTASEPEIYALAFSDGALYVGSSPNGKVYRVDPSSGKATVLFDPQQAYIWAISPLGRGLAVATGVQGKLFRVDSAGKGELWFQAPETHLRTLAVKGENDILAGGAGGGRIYEITGKEQGRALFDSTLSEISSICWDRANNYDVGWAAGVSNVLPSTPPAAKPAQKPAAASGTSTTSSENKKDEDAAAASSVEVSFSFEEPAAPGAPATPPGSSELYRITPDGFVDLARKFDRETIYALVGDGSGGVWIATGPSGRVYDYKQGELALIGTLPEKQVVALAPAGATMLAATSNSGGVYRLGGSAEKPEFRSAVKDTERFSRFGHFRLEGADLGDGRLAVSFRSGNTSTPDNTWSGWSAPVKASEGQIEAPSARYLQAKLDVLSPSPQMRIDNAVFAYVNRNVAPVIDSVAVQEPGVIFVSSSYPQAPQIVEATNPDENGIFTSLDAARERGGDAGKRMFRKGYRTVTWKAHDPNGDTLRYTVNFRRKGETKWLRLRENIDESQANFDTSQLPDGAYELQLLATDAPDNVEGALSDTNDGAEFVVDNTPPRIEIGRKGSDIVIRVTDQLSNVIRAEYSVDAKKWKRLTPLDGIADSPDETFAIPAKEIEGRFAVVRAVDSSYNASTANIAQ
jgi:hypothetical protein